MNVGTGACFSLRSVTVAYGGIKALEGVDLTVSASEAVGLVGLSGAGKTTLLRLVNGTLRPSQGSVEVNGRNLAQLTRGELREMRAAIGFVHQDLSLIPNVRVLHNVLSGRLGRLSFLRGMRALVAPPLELVEEAYSILERVGIADKLYQRTDRLSGGERQRVAIARALFQSPEGLLADEPVSSVDPARAREVVKLLCEISLERGLTLCVSLHHLSLAREFFPRLIGLRAGRIVFDRPAEKLGEAEFRALYELEEAGTGGQPFQGLAPVTRRARQPVLNCVGLPGPGEAEQ